MQMLGLSLTPRSTVRVTESIVRSISSERELCDNAQPAVVPSEETDGVRLLVWPHPPVSFSDVCLERMLHPQWPEHCSSASVLLAGALYAINTTILRNYCEYSLLHHSVVSQSVVLIVCSLPYIGQNKHCWVQSTQTYTISYIRSYCEYSLLHHSMMSQSVVLMVCLLPYIG